MRIGLVTGGGDCPGLNPVIRAVVKGATRLGWQVIGIEDAFRGILEPGREGWKLLDREAVSGILPRGGTILGTSNRSNPFIYPVREDGRLVERDLTEPFLQRIRDLQLDGIVMAGGDGSLDICRRLIPRGMKVIGVPKTIDNDLSMTDQTFGFDTARAIATDAVDKLHTTAEAHDRVMVLEVMGRNSGFLALHAGIAGGADVILIPEIPYRIDSIVDAIRGRMAGGRSFSIAVVAEGAYPDGGSVSIESSANAVAGRGVVKLGGAGKVMADSLAARIELEVRVTVLGHLQRGGSPSPYDRILGTQMGDHAVELAAAGRWNEVVVLRGTQIMSVPLTEDVTRQKKVEPHGQLAETARHMGICLGE